MAKMFDEWSIGSMTVRNRFVRAATTESLCTKDGVPSKRMIDVYGGLKRGGSGMIITGYAYVTEDGKASERSVSLCDDGKIDGLRELVDAVHASEKEEEPVAKPPSVDTEGRRLATMRFANPEIAHDETDVPTRIIAQLVYGGSKSKLAPGDARLLPIGDEDDAEVHGKHAKAVPNTTIVGPSEIAHPATGLVPRAATQDDIERIVNAFADAAGRAKRAGFDGVEVHAAHGYLLSQFLDGRFNERADEYGGTLQGRAKLAIECVKAVRAQVGDDYPVLVKLNSCDVFGDTQGDKGGMTEEESLLVAKWLVDAGASCIEVSGDWHAVESDDVSGEPFFGSFGTRLARHLDVPVIVTGGWRDPDTIERYLDTTDIAGIGMARPLISQPYLPELWASGMDNSAECISCNFCAKHNGIPCILRKGR